MQYKLPKCNQAKAAVLGSDWAVLVAPKLAALIEAICSGTQRTVRLTKRPKMTAKTTIETCEASDSSSHMTFDRRHSHQCGLYLCAY